MLIDSWDRDGAQHWRWWGQWCWVTGVGRKLMPLEWNGWRLLEDGEGEGDGHIGMGVPLYVSDVCVSVSVCHRIVPNKHRL